jgi:hypothetical protein
LRVARRHDLAGHAVDERMNDPTVVPQQRDFVNEIIVPAAQLAANRIGPHLRANQPHRLEGIGQMVGGDRLARLGRAEAGALERLCAGGRRRRQACYHPAQSNRTQPHSPTLAPRA